jgi:hypothetical protein
MDQNRLASLNNQLNDLLLRFDQGIINGSCFSDVKNIYLQMKDIKSKISTKQIEANTTFFELFKTFRFRSSNNGLINPHSDQKS